jgi:hypothetical protein
MGSTLPGPSSTPSAPAAAAVRRIVPRLPGLLMASSTPAASRGGQRPRGQRQHGQHARRGFGVAHGGHDRLIDQCRLDIQCGQQPLASSPAAQAGVV